MAGEILKNKREDLGLEIHEIAESLKIGEDCLSAIENDAFEKLPVAVYTMGYIRSYAALVGIDADPIIEFYRQHLSQPQPSTIIPIAFSRKKGSKAGYLFAALVLVVVAFLLFPGVTRKKNTRPAAGSSVTEKAPSVPPAVNGPAPNAAVQQGGAAETASVAGQHDLFVTADDTTWIAVTFRNGRREEILLRPGQSKNWSFSGRAFLKVGNAGGINISLDGKDLGKPGVSGQVKSMTLPPTEEGQ